jgi:hypothetical protein
LPIDIIKAYLLLRIEESEGSARLVSYYPYSKAGETIPISLIISGISIYRKRDAVGVVRINIILPYIYNNMYLILIDSRYTDKVLLILINFVVVVIVKSITKLSLFFNDVVIRI